MSYLEFFVAGNPAMAREVVAKSLAVRGFPLEWTDPWTATFKRGADTKRFYAGGRKRNFTVRLLIVTSQPGESVVRVECAAPSRIGAVVSAVQRETLLSSLRSEIVAVLGPSGALRAVRHFPKRMWPIRPLNRLAAWSMILSLLGFVFGVPAVLGVSLAIVSLRRIRAGNSAQRGVAWAVAAIVVGVLLGLVGFALLISVLSHPS